MRAPSSASGVSWVHGKQTARSALKPVRSGGFAYGGVAGRAPVGARPIASRRNRRDEQQNRERAASCWNRMCARVLMIARIWTRSLSPEDKAAVARLAIKDRRRPPEASADQPEAQTVRLAAAGSSAAAAAAASVDTPGTGHVIRLPRHARSHGRRQWPTTLPQVRSPDSTGAFFAGFNSGRRALGGVEHHCHAQRRWRVHSAMTLLSAVSYRHQSGHRPPAARRHRIGDAAGGAGDRRRRGLHVRDVPWSPPCPTAHARHLGRRTPWMVGGWSCCAR